MRWVAFAAGVVVVAGTGLSVGLTLVVPRGYRSRLVVVVDRAIEGLFRVMSARLRRYESKDRVLVGQAPAALIGVLGVWLGLLWVGFALVLTPFGPRTFGAALREAGSSMLTLGFATTPSAGAGAVDFLAAATGLVVVALQIAYLPTLYGAFNRRETNVTLLQSRAGAPAWGPEILARHELVNTRSNLPDFYAEWERWSADVMESHTTYPVLVRFRSPHPLRSWIVALVSVLDSAALYLSLCPASAPIAQARLCLRMGFLCLREVAHAVGIPHDHDPSPDDPIELTYEQFLEGVAHLQGAGFPIERSPEEAWPDFHGWRVNYEAVAYALADYVVAPPAPWTGERTRLRGITVAPKRPIDRKPGDTSTKAIPKSSSDEWRA